MSSAVLQDAARRVAHIKCGQEITSDAFVFLTRGTRAAQAAFFQDGQNELFDGAGIGRGFQDGKLSFITDAVDGESPCST
jgi:hypothetical protein